MFGNAEQRRAEIRINKKGRKHKGEIFTMISAPFPILIRTISIIIITIISK